MAPNAQISNPKQAIYLNMEALAPDTEVLPSSLFCVPLARARARALSHTPLPLSIKVATPHFEHVTTFKRNPHTLLESESSLLLPAYNNPPAARLQVSLTPSLPPSLPHFPPLWRVGSWVTHEHRRMGA